MIIVDKDFVEKPFDTDYMKYNYDEHRYCLTYEGAEDTNISLIESMYTMEFVNNYLDLLSRTIYAILSKNKDSKYYERQLWNLSHSRRNREAIELIFRDVLWYNYTSGGFMTLYQSGINLNEMKQLDLNIDNGLSVISNQMANMTGINERVLKNDIVRIMEFKTFDEFKEELVVLNIFTQDQIDKFKSILDVPKTYRYIFGINLFNGNYYIKDTNYWKEQLDLKGTEW